MKKFLPVLLLSAFLFTTSCGNNSSNNATPDSNNKTRIASESSSGIVGEWEQVHTVYDKNGNNLLDEDEKKAPSSTKIGDYYFRFDANGNCLFSEMKFEGSYEVKDEKGKQTLFIQAGDPRKFRILSLNENEMVLMPTGAPGTFFVYRRI